VPDNLLAGVDIGGTKTAVVLSSRPPATLTEHVFATLPKEGPEPAIRRIVDGLRQALALQPEGKERLSAIGVSCGGPLDAATGTIHQPPNLSTWKDIPITSILAREFGVKCYLENDANAGALAEHSFGAGRGMRDLIFLTMGTGMGAGLILNGQLYRGASNSAGEIGHVRLTRTGPIGYHKAGSVEGWASGAGMAQMARTEIAKAQTRHEATLLATALNDLDELTARDVSEAAERGDPLAQRIIEATGARLGQTMAILIDVLNPEGILVGGLALRLGESLLGPARKIVERETLLSSARACRILPAALGEEIGNVAALCVAMEGERHDGQSAAS
jgi:glucokinase